LDGGNCNGGLGSGGFDSGPLPFVKESCLWDPFATAYRKISCFDEDTIVVEWYSDSGCSTADMSYKVHNDTCYYGSGNMVSADPTYFPSEPPTPLPTATAPPTLPPIVISYEVCVKEKLVEELEDTFLEVNDQQWIEDCEDLLLTETSRIDVVCGCIGKFSESMANEHLNCLIESPYHGIQIWNMCRSTIYAQSCGSKCTGWLRRIAVDNGNHRRIGVADDTFKLRWSIDVCGEIRKCSDPDGATPASNDCTCGSTICVAGEYCLATKNMCYNNAVCKHTDASMIETSSCTCGYSGFECNANDLGAFLCDEFSETPCVGLSACLSGSGSELTTVWCKCQYATSSEFSYCSSAQYCDVANGWCSQYPTCSDDSGTIATTQHCSCGSPTIICSGGEYCKPNNSPGSCSATKTTDEPTDSPSPSPTQNPSPNPTDNPSPNPTENPSPNPTTPAPTCIPYMSWNENYATEACPQGTWGGTNKGYGTMIACDQSYQTELEESAANELYKSCSSWCIFDFQSLLSETRLAYIWKKKGCWQAVTKWSCFQKGSLTFFEELVDYAPTICPTDPGESFQKLLR